MPAATGFGATRAEIVDRIEAAAALDPVAQRVQAVLRPIFGRGVAQRVLSGASIGHRLHPALVAVPIGSWLSASMLDLTFGDRAAARRLIGFGCLAAIPAAAAGATDWLETSGADRRTGLVHAVLNDLALVTYAGSWRARRRGHHVRGSALALGASGVLAAAGWLGGHLAYSRGVGVDRRTDA